MLLLTGIGCPPALGVLAAVAIVFIVEPDEDEDRCQKGDDAPNPHEGQVGHQQWDLEMELLPLSTDACPKQ